MTTKDILREKVGVCREYVKIFSEFCELAGYRVKGIRGYTKGPNFVPGTYLNIKCGCIDFSSFLSDTFFNYCLVIARVSGFLSMKMEPPYFIFQVLFWDLQMMSHPHMRGMQCI